MTTPPTEQPAGRTALYRFFDAAGNLLYVGVTKNPKSRWQTHALEQCWWHLVTRNEVTWCPSRREAAAAEKQAIRDEDPVYNYIWKKERVTRLAGELPPDPFLEPFVNAMRDEILAGKYPPGHVFLDDLATALSLGVSLTTFSKAFYALQREELVVYRPQSRSQGRRCASFVVT